MGLNYQKAKQKSLAAFLDREKTSVASRRNYKQFKEALKHFREQRGKSGKPRCYRIEVLTYPKVYVASKSSV